MGHSTSQVQSNIQKWVLGSTGGCKYDSLSMDFQRQIHGIITRTENVPNVVKSFIINRKGGRLRLSVPIVRKRLPLRQAPVQTFQRRKLHSQHICSRLFRKKMRRQKYLWNRRLQPTDINVRKLVGRLLSSLYFWPFLL